MNGTANREHLITYNIETAREYARPNQNELSDKSVLYLLDIRYEFAFEIVRRSGISEDELRNTIRRFADAEMIPTMWMVAPRDLASRGLKLLGSHECSALLKLKPNQGHFWLVAFSDGGSAVAQVSFASRPGN